MLAGTVVLATFLAAAWPAAAGRAWRRPTSAVVAQELRADFNGDDLDDLAVGVPGEDLGVHADAGAVNVQYGSAAGWPGTGRCSPRGRRRTATASARPWPRASSTTTTSSTWPALPPRTSAGRTRPAW